MSSMVCQGLRSCLQPGLVEPRPLGLKMVATNAHSLKPNNLSESLPLPELDTYSFETKEGNVEKNDDKNFTCNDTTDNDDVKKDNSDSDSGGWSFIQAITNTKASDTVSIEAKEDQHKAYVHPLSKRSASHLSTKSLELCTETLGSETGSDIGDDIDMSYSSSDSEGTKSPKKERSRLFGRKKGDYGSFPPPLTSISGSSSYSIRPHREGGRLVMKAVLVPSPKTCFKAERRDGRLLLHYIKSSEFSYSSDSDQEQEERKMDHQDTQDDCVEEEISGNNANVGGAIERGKFVQRPSRCKEGGRGYSSNNGLLIWEPFWVAT